MFSKHTEKVHLSFPKSQPIPLQAPEARRGTEAERARAKVISEGKDTSELQEELRQLKAALEREKATEQRRLQVNHCSFCCTHHAE